MDRVIVIKSNDKGLNEAFEELKNLCLHGFSIEEKEEPQESNKEGEYVSLHAYEELERQLDKAIEERNKLEKENKRLSEKNKELRGFVAEFIIKSNKIIGR